MATPQKMIQSINFTDSTGLFTGQVAIGITITDSSTSSSTSYASRCFNMTAPERAEVRLEELPYVMDVSVTLEESSSTFRSYGFTKNTTLVVIGHFQ